jgi:hypothetical protein
MVFESKQGGMNVPELLHKAHISELVNAAWEGKEV